MPRVTQLVCIGCPKGCRLTVDTENNHAVFGNACPVGHTYGQKELQNPTRVVCSTARVFGAEICRIPVKTDREIPKKLMREAVLLLNDLTLHAPVVCGEIVLANLLGTGANFVATRSLPGPAVSFPPSFLAE